MQHEKREAGFLILCDLPGWGDYEAQLKDNYGKMIWAMLYNSGFPANDTKVEFLWKNIYEKRQGRNPTRQIIARVKPKVILALGRNVLKALDLGDELEKCRGSRFNYGESTIVVPTYHPQDLRKPMKFGADDPIAKQFITAYDIQKAVDVYNNGFEPPAERFNVTPTIEDFREFLDMVKTKNPILGADLEGTGLSIEKSKIYVHGFAWSESDAICIPEYGKNFEPYWTPEEWEEVKEGLNWIYSNGKLLFQNGVGYDVPLLRARGWDMKLSAFYHDTMIMHHAINPELPHNIGFISSMFGKTPYWKESFLTKKETIDKTDQIAMRTYNCRDCVVLLQIHSAMEDHLKELMDSDPVYSKIPEVVRKGIEVARVTVKMYETGIPLDEQKVKVWTKFLKENLERTEAEVVRLGNLPPEFNLASTADKRLLLYGEMPDKLKKIDVLEELRKYEEPPKNYQYECTHTGCGRKVTKRFYDWEEVPNEIMEVKCPACKKLRRVVRTEKAPTPVKGKSKESQKYQDLKALETLAKVKPLYKLSGYEVLTTEGGGSAIDKGAITRYIQHIDKRLDAIGSIVRRRKAHDEEEKGLRETKTFLVALAEFTKFQTLTKSFATFPTWEDGRVRPRLLVTGTATGRFSCKDPNLQQVPSKKVGKIIRSCFRAPKGWKLLGVDFSNLEVQVGARFMGDDVLIQQLEAGLNIHDENTKTFFGISEDDERWTPFRSASKIIQFGRLFYGGRDQGIFSQVITAVPDSGLTLKMFKEAVQRYMEAHPKFAQWCAEVQELAQTKRISPNAFGRVRTLFGSDNANSRRALNSPIQGSASDVVRDDMIDIDSEFEEKNLRSRIVLNVHDEILFMIPDEELPVAWPIIRDIMSRERHVNGYTFRIPIDAELGTHWGEMGKFDEETFELIGDSKHV